MFVLMSSCALHCCIYIAYYCTIMMLHYRVLNMLEQFVSVVISFTGTVLLSRT